VWGARRPCRPHGQPGVDVLGVDITMLSSALSALAPQARPGRAAEVSIFGKFSKHPSAGAAELYLFICGIPVRGGYRHGVLHRQYITWAAGGSRGASSTPLIASRCNLWATAQRQGWGDLLPTLRPAEASTQNDGSETLGVGAPASAAVPVSVNGRRAAPVSTTGQAPLTRSVSSKSTTARHYRRRKGAWRDPAPS
jgi:hypothetical protein